MNDNLGFNPVSINKVYQTEGVKLPQKAKTEPVTDTVEITKQKSGKSKRNKILAGLAIATTALVIGISVYKKKKALNSIPPELKELFNSLKEKSGKEYIDDAYSGLVKHMGLDDIAPKSVNLTDNADGIFSITGGYNPLENTIEYSKGFSKRLNKEQQFNMLSHELTHCKQFTQVIRTEGLGVEALAEGIAGKTCLGRTE